MRASIMVCVCVCVVININPPEAEETLTMRPYFCWRMMGHAALVTLYVPVVLLHGRPQTQPIQSCIKDKKRKKA